MTEAQEVAASIWDGLMSNEREGLIWMSEEQVHSFIRQIMREKPGALVDAVADALEAIISKELRGRADEAA